MQAENTVSVRAENVEVKNNRLFDVDIYVYSTFNLAAATFEISYDSSAMEYREVDTEIEGGMVKSADKNGKVKAIFLKSDGVSDDGEIKLFSAKFKAVSSGVCDITILMYDCVDNNVVTLNTETSAQLTVVISGSSSDAITYNNQKSKKENITQNANEETENKSTKFLSVASPDNKEKEYLVIILILALVVMGLMSYISKLKNKKESSEQLANISENSNEQEENDISDCDSPDSELIKNELTEAELTENTPKETYD